MDSSADAPSSASAADTKSSESSGKRIAIIIIIDVCTHVQACYK